jgi:iron complex transport system ATP-binding protein
MGLVVNNISMKYGKTPVFSNISLKLDSGTICGLMGRNIRNMTRSKIAGLISVVPQINSSPFSFSCVDMVLMAGVSRIKSWSSPSKKERSKAEKVLEETGITHLAYRAFNSISGGEQQLVMLARALFQETPVMLLDEPNSHLDFVNQHRIMSLIKQLVKKRNIIVLITLHDPNLVNYYCDEVVLLKNGSIVASGKTKAIMTDNTLASVLGNNIQCDVTKKGICVVTPKKINDQGNFLEVAQ